MTGGVVELGRRLRSGGAKDTARRVVRRLYDRLDSASLDFSLLPGDIADSATLAAHRPTVVAEPRALTIGWVTTPPVAGSGGHTTMFRMIQSLERAGHACRVLIYDRHHGNLEQHAAVVREGWPWVRADVVGVDDGLGGLDAVVATGWPTAHVVARREPAAHRFYFVQDFEPYFFPRGSVYELAADTYRFGFTHIALGHMVQDRLRSEIGADSHLVPFSCDVSTYRMREDVARSGIVLYAKPDVARRGYRLSALALAEFHRRHPEHQIHLYGNEVTDIDVPVVRHGRLTPEELCALYQRCVAGLAMSFTNISLVAEEMLASGCVPVVNDSVDSRADLDNPHPLWVAPTPHHIAEALCAAVEHEDVEGRARAAAASVRTDDWQGTGSQVVRIIEDVVRGR